jgi:23S rRNA pseudouridine1911/1915/1917 synthase
MDEKVESNWYIGNDMHGLRADQYLARRIGRISRERAHSIILARDFLIDNRIVKPSSRVKSGQRATLKRFAPDATSDIENFSIEKIYEDNNILVVSKPPGLNIHPTANCLYKTLTFWLRSNYPGEKIHPCHRIDKETSGIVVCAKNRPAESLIKTAFMRGEVQKTYLAVVEGLLTKARMIEIPLGLQKDKGLVAIRMIEDPLGKIARTKIRPVVIDGIGNRTLVLCKPLTGRQHQIRAHLSLIGHAIVGDKLYQGGDEFFDRFTKGDGVAQKTLAHYRHALHATAIKFRLYDRFYSFKAPFPSDLRSLIKKR